MEWLLITFFIMLPRKTDTSLKRGKVMKMVHLKGNWAAFNQTVSKGKVFK